ncbi:uncharacterized protein BO88DRAFT_14273 [Aspergillus vadensis CBS 113365]|uniref:Uncharacterized protein n=1 Tax=Aspergillus vadensis (strain CBS 113365 / IMI 142717 / IBT 24658) TaxID=1448311 RepID=A0A319BPJ9_ASPVC|nr:hypothetical protein BO88DRAFT_14273 [Aspergillus vadensis CBS 113365]PYH74477.1 hypothetical protein BO88DRAFT_14273 [Aspergillus vadensis CBS 113365]
MTRAHGLPWPLRCCSFPASSSANSRISLNYPFHRWPDTSGGSTPGGYSIRFHDDDVNDRLDDDDSQGNDVGDLRPEPTSSSHQPIIGQRSEYRYTVFREDDLLERETG